MQYVCKNKLENNILVVFHVQIFWYCSFLDRKQNLKITTTFFRNISRLAMQICELMSPNYTMFPCYYYKQLGCSSSVHQPANLLKVMGVRCQLLLAQCKAGDISKKCGSYFKVLFSKNEQYQKGPGISHKYICYHFRKIKMSQISKEGVYWPSPTLCKTSLLLLRNVDIGPTHVWLWWFIYVWSQDSKTTIGLISCQTQL